MTSRKQFTVSRILHERMRRTRATSGGLWACMISSINKHWKNLIATDLVRCGTLSARPHYWMNVAPLNKTRVAACSRTSRTRDGVFTISSVASCHEHSHNVPTWSVLVPRCRLRWFQQYARSWRAPVPPGARGAPRIVLDCFALVWRIQWQRWYLVHGWSVDTSEMWRRIVFGNFDTMKRTVLRKFSSIQQNRSCEKVERRRCMASSKVHLCHQCRPKAALPTVLLIAAPNLMKLRASIKRTNVH